jgi:hydrogenase maturation protease
LRILIAGVGYQNLRDLSVGPVLVPVLRELDWPAGVDIGDLSFGPIAVVQRFQDRPNYYDRVVFLSGVERGREPGQVYCYCWAGELPDSAEIQTRVGEAVTGVINLDNLLIIAQYYEVLPDDVVVVEVEPVDTGWGEGFTPSVEAVMDDVIATVRRAALEGCDGRSA